MNDFDLKVEKLKDIRYGLVWDDWAIHWLISTVVDINYNDEDRK